MCALGGRIKRNALTRPPFHIFVEEIPSMSRIKLCTDFAIGEYFSARRPASRAKARDASNESCSAGHTGSFDVGMLPASNERRPLG
jgi:hypothetical protein